MSDTSRVEKLQAMLDAVEDAILKVTAGQSYSLGSRTVTRADLSDLMDTRRELKQELDHELGTNRRKFKRIVPMG
ncbi:MAG: hypothetical protein IJ087_01635 [Eggerthellaceae bacterium]|nr:hypothetical protein [Eggerthellaceae bacterium]